MSQLFTLQKMTFHYLNPYFEKVNIYYVTVSLMKKQMV